MALPCPGPAPISLLDIQNEFGGTYLDGTYTQIKEYYRGGSYVPDNELNQNIPKSGQISFDQFFCSSGEIIVVIGSGTDIIVKSLFGDYWNSIRPKRLIVSSGAVIGPSNTINPGYQAMLVDGNYNGILTIENRGSIQGGGGRRGGDPILFGETRTNQNNGGNGGAAAMRIYPALYSTSVKIQNKSGASILGGGGGGGRGGVNSQSYTQTVDNASYRYTITVTPTGGYGGYGQGYLIANTIGTTEVAASATAQFNANLGGTIVAKLSSGSSMAVNRNGGGNVTYNLSPGSSSRFNANGNTNITAYVSNGASASFNLNGNGTVNFYVSSGGTVSLNRNVGTSPGVVSIYGTGASGVSVNQNPTSGTVNRYLNGVNYDQTEIQFQAYVQGIVDFVTTSNPASVRGGTGGTYGNAGDAGQNGAYGNGSPGGSPGISIRGIENAILENSGTISGPTSNL